MSLHLDTLHSLSEHSASPVLLTSIGPHRAQSIPNILFVSFSIKIKK